MYNNGKTSNELWAVTTKDGRILWTRGGSSSSPKLMVYETKKKAETALTNNWSDQVHKDTETEIRQIYSKQ